MISLKSIIHTIRNLISPIGAIQAKIIRTITKPLIQGLVRFGAGIPDIVETLEKMGIRKDTTETRRFIDNIAQPIIREERWIKADKMSIPKKSLYHETKLKMPQEYKYTAKITYWSGLDQRINTQFVSWYTDTPGTPNEMIEQFNDYKSTENMYYIEQIIDYELWQGLRQKGWKKP